MHNWYLCGMQSSPACAYATRSVRPRPTDLRLALAPADVGVGVTWARRILSRPGPHAGAGGAERRYYGERDLCLWAHCVVLLDQRTAAANAITMLIQNNLYTAPISHAPQFFAYEYCKRGFQVMFDGWRAVQGAKPSDASAALSFSSPSVTEREAQVRSLTSGAAAGVIGKLAVYPLDTVKRRLQVQGMTRSSSYGATKTYRGTLHALASIAREEGPIAGWYKGTVPAVLKSAVGAAVTFWSYEATLSALRRGGWLLAPEQGLGLEEGQSLSAKDTNGGMLAAAAVACACTR